MLARRIIPCLDVNAGRVVKGTNFLHLRDAGDPVEVASRYEAEGADELVFLDINAFTPDGKTLIVAGVDKNVRTFENFAAKKTLSGHADWVYSLAISPDGKTLASGDWSGEVRTWDLAEGKPLKNFLAAPGYKAP